MLTDATVISFIQAVVLIAISPLITGLIRKFKAMMQHRIGSSIIQPYRDLLKLFRKDSVVSESTSWMFRLIPYVCLSSMVLIALMIPFIFTGIIAPYGDLIALVYLFTLYRFAMVLGGLEGGSCFGGMGSSREMMMSVLIEPALLLSIMAIAVLSGGGTDISNIPVMLCNMGFTAFCPALILAASSFIITMLAENARIPFDNPSTHLELTMVHEAMLIEYSGKDLGMMELSAEMRLTIFMAMLCSLFFPWGIATTTAPSSIITGTIAVMAKMVTIAFLIALLESSLTKSRLFKTPNLLTASFVLSLLAMVSLYTL
ncbi:MAG: NADH-quinone oxidoreductase subunit H [Candidatus Methanomethylophilaceae archaeon]